MSQVGCVILAAGKNTRLDTGKPKSLLEINGQSILERHIALFSQNDVDKFCVITGHQSEEMDKAVEKIKLKYEVSISTIHNDQYELENGFSVWKAKKWVDQHAFNSFILTMADHVFEGAFIRKFLAAEKDFLISKLYLAVDQPGNHNTHIDIEDVTKVLGENGLIQAIGKQITNYNYYDTGLFEMSKEVFKEFEACFDQKKYSISHMVDSLTAKGQSHYIKLYGHSWNDVDNTDDYTNSQGLNLD